MKVDKEWIVIRFSLMLPLIATIASLVMSIIEIIYHWHDIIMVAGSIITMAVAGVGFFNFLLVLGTADGLNAPHTIHQRTKRFLFIGVMNLTLFIMEVLLF